jgi:hypothetical protein
MIEVAIAFCVVICLLVLLSWLYDAGIGSGY